VSNYLRVRFSTDELQMYDSRCSIRATKRHHNTAVPRRTTNTYGVARETIRATKQPPTSHLAKYIAASLSNRAPAPKSSQFSAYLRHFPAYRPAEWWQMMQAVGSSMVCFFTTHCSLRLIVRSELDVPTFATRCLHACHHARAPSGGRWKCGREMSGNFA
jgi:hypothetical protein